MKKRIISLILVCMMLVTLLPTGAFATDYVASNETTLTSAVSLASPGDTVTLTADIDLTAELSVTNQITLDLDGHVLRQTTSGLRVINVGSGGDLTIKDSNTGSTTHYFTYHSTAEWVYLPTHAVDSTEIALADITTAAPVNGDSVIAVPGGCITGGSGATYGGNIKNAGTLTLQSGTVVGGKISSTSQWKGAGVFNDGTFTMAGGAIAGNCAYTGAGVQNGGTFFMTGGRIVSNAGTLGGGVNSEGGTSFSMTGGEITGNRAGSGGGVRIFIDPVLGGSARIAGNTADGTTPNNIFLGNSKKITVQPGFTGSAGVNGYTPTAGSPVAVTGTNDGDYSSNFSSDNGYIVMNDANVVKFVLPAAETGGVKYATVQGAVNAAASGDTVKLLANVTETLDLGGKEIVFDLNGFLLPGAVTGKATVDGVEFNGTGVTVEKNGPNDFAVSGTFTSIVPVAGTKLTLVNATVPVNGTVFTSGSTSGVVTVNAADNYTISGEFTSIAPADDAVLTLGSNVSAPISADGAAGVKLYLNAHVLTDNLTLNHGADVTVYGGNSVNSGLVGKLNVAEDSDLHIVSGLFYGSTVKQVAKYAEKTVAAVGTNMVAVGDFDVTSVESAVVPDQNQENALLAEYDAEKVNYVNVTVSYGGVNLTSSDSVEFIEDQHIVTSMATAAEGGKEYFALHWNTNKFDQAVPVTASGNQYAFDAKSFSPYIIITGKDYCAVSVNSDDTFTVTGLNPLVEKDTTSYTAFNLTVADDCTLNGIKCNGTALTTSTSDPVYYSGTAPSYTVYIKKVGNGPTAAYSFEIDATKDTYNVSYAAGTGASGTVPVDGAKYAVGDLITLKEPTMLTKSGATAGKHYVFNGWQYNGTTYAAGSTVALAKASSTVVTTITAQWTEVDNDKYVVYYNLNGGTDTYANNAYASGVTVTAGAAATRTGYVFDGWSYNNSAVTVAAAGTFTMPAENVTLYAKWTAQTYTVVYSKGADTGITGAAPADGNTYVKGAFFTAMGEGTLAKPNYSFAGWTTTDGDGTVDYLAGSSYVYSGTGALTLYPVFNAETLYTLKSNDNYGSAADAVVGSTVTGGVVVAPAAPGTRTDYKFLSWNTRADGLGTTYMPGSNVTMYADTTLYAQWECTKTYAVTFAKGTATGADETIQGTAPSMLPQREDTVIVLPANPFTVQNNADGTSFTMVGWNDGTQTYAPGSEYEMGAAAVTFTAQWVKIDPNQAYVVYNANGGVNPPVDVNVYAKGATPAAKTAEAMTKDGFTFTKWNTKADGTGTNYNAGAAIAALPAGTTVLYAVWQTVPTYSVIYNPNYDGAGGTTGGSGYVPTDANKYADTEIFEVKGVGTMEKNATATHYYVFEGWNSVADGTGEKIMPGSSVEMSADLRDDSAPNTQLTLFAIWKEVAFETYPVIYDLAGGTYTAAYDTALYVKGADVSTAAAPARTDYTFRGWAYGSIDSGIVYGQDGFAVTDAFPMPAETVYLIAIWDEQLNVTYDGNGATGGTAVTDGTVYYAGGSAVVKANTFTRTDYSFDSWNTQPNGTGITYKAGDSLPITDDITLYAQWSTNYKIIFDDNLADPLDDFVTIDGCVDADGMIEKPNLISSKMIPTVPVYARVNYRFVGWYTTPECNDYDVFYTNRTLAANYIDTLDEADGNPHDKTVTLYAKWQWAPNGTEESHEDKITIRTAALEDGTYGVYYSDYIEAYDELYDSDLRVYRNFKLVSGTLPAGLYLNSRTGEVYGVPTAVTAAEGVTFTVRMTDDSGRKISEADKQITIVIKQLPLTVDRNAALIYEKTYGDLEPTDVLMALNLTVKVGESGELLNTNTYDFGGTSTVVTFSNVVDDQQFSLAFDYAGANGGNPANHALFTDAVTKTQLEDNLQYADAYNTMAAFTDTFTAGTVRQAGEDAETYKISLADTALTAPNKAQYAITIPAEFADAEKAVAPAVDTAKYIFTIHAVNLLIDKTTVTAHKTYGTDDPAFFCNTADVSFTGTYLPAAAPTITKDDDAQTVTITYANGIADVINLPFDRIEGEDAGTYRIYLESTVPVTIHSNSGTDPVADSYARNYETVVINATLADKTAASAEARYNFYIDQRPTVFTPTDAAVTYGELKIGDKVEGSFGTMDIAVNEPIGVKDSASDVKVKDETANKSGAGYLKYNASAYDVSALTFTVTNGADPKGTADADTTANYAPTASLTVGKKALTVNANNVDVVKGTVPAEADVKALTSLNGVLSGDTVTLKVTGYVADVNGDTVAETYATAADLVAAFTTFNKKLDADMEVKVSFTVLEGADKDNYSISTASPVTAALKAYTPSYGGGYVETKYSITCGEGVTANKTKAAGGAKVTLEIEAGYEYTIVKTSAGKKITVNKDNTFTMPEANVTVTVYKMPFTDVKKGDWFYDDVLYVYANGLMNGTGGTNFSPYVTTTRGMVVTMLYRLEGEPAVSGACPFDDVAAGSYCEKAIIWAAANNIVGGDGNGKYRPDNEITREQMATILYRYAQYKSYATGGKADLAAYTDMDKISAWAAEAMAWANDATLVTGVGGGELNPQGDATRAQLAAILHRFCENVVK